MLPMLNGKSFLECTENDFLELLENPDYRENEYIDYKEAFAFLDIPKKTPEREKKIAEFRSDVCAFANADGGFLIYGISDEKGMAKELIGIDIPDGNTDRFELDRKNNLSTILPKIPLMSFKFIPLANGKYIVVLFIRRDEFVPYVHIENEVNYQVYKRIGNGKRSMGYVEMQELFKRSVSIEKEIQLYRQQRVEYYRSQEDTDDYRFSKFILFHIIPNTFMDSAHRKNLFLLQKQKPNLKFSLIFNDMGCNCFPQPNVDGLCFPSYRGGAECFLNNNGIAECHIPVYSHLNFNGPHPNGYIPSEYYWNRFENVIRQYIDTMSNVLGTKKLFLCTSILGCKNVMSENNFETVTVSYIDRNTIFCNPITIENVEDDDSIEMALTWLHIEYLLALGIKSSRTLNDLIKEISYYDNN